MQNECGWTTALLPASIFFQFPNKWLQAKEDCWTIPQMWGLAENLGLLRRPGFFMPKNGFKLGLGNGITAPSSR